MDIGKVYIDSVIVGPRHRELDADKVEALAESIDELGLQQPITVFVEDDVVNLIAGRHRLEAARKLGWEQVEASFVKMTPVRREMWEIAENLFRVDLSKEQRDEHIRRYAELLAEDAKLQTAHNEAIESKREDGRGHRQEGIAKKIADQTGLSKSTVQRAINNHTKPPRVIEPQDDAEVLDRQVDALMSAWNKASAEAREEFMSRIDVPVFDRSAA